MQFDIHKLYVPPTTVGSLDAVPISQHQLYKRDGAGGYQLHSGGQVLARLRGKTRDAGYALSILPPAPGGKLPLLNAREWAQTISTATPHERRVLLIAVARGELSISK